MTAAVRREGPGAPWRWDGVEVRPYKAADGASPAPFHEVSRQVLFDREGFACQIRFFQVEPGGHTTLERHEHGHAVIVLTGRGRCLVDATLYDLQPHDLVEVPAWHWHQFRADPDEGLGFLCIVNRERDRPRRPTGDELELLRRDPGVAAFLAPDGGRASPPMR